MEEIDRLIVELNSLLDDVGPKVERIGLIRKRISELQSEQEGDGGPTEQG